MSLVAFFFLCLPIAKLISHYFWTSFHTMCSILRLDTIISGPSYRHKRKDVKKQKRQPAEVSAAYIVCVSACTGQLMIYLRTFMIC